MSSQDESALSLMLDRFETAWTSGTVPKISDFLLAAADQSNSFRKSLLIELVMIDLERHDRRDSSYE